MDLKKRILQFIQSTSEKISMSILIRHFWRETNILGIWRVLEELEDDNQVTIKRPKSRTDLSEVSIHA